VTALRRMSRVSRLQSRAVRPGGGLAIPPPDYYDMFNQPVSNALRTLTPLPGRTRADHCKGDGLVGMIPTAALRADGVTESPWKVRRSSPTSTRLVRSDRASGRGRIGVGRNGCRPIPRRHPAHEAFIKPDEPSYFQELALAASTCDRLCQRQHHQRPQHKRRTGLCDPANVQAA